MADRPGGLRRDPSVAAWQEKAAENKAALTKKQRRDRQRVRAKYDMPEELKAAVAAIGEKWDTSASQAASLLLGWAVMHYAAGDPEIELAREDGRGPSRTPKFEWNVDLPEAWFEVFEQFVGSSNGAKGKP